jgi:hypothetical protein
MQRQDIGLRKQFVGVQRRHLKALKLGGADERVIGRNLKTGATRAAQHRPRDAAQALRWQRSFH